MVRSRSGPRPSESVHAVAQLPPQYNHPVRVAERAAVLDLLSDGRVELGTGRSTTLIEMEGFGIDPEESKPMWEEAISIIPRMWLEDPFSHEGRYFKIPPRSVIPKPVQKPHPPCGWPVPSPPVLPRPVRKGLARYAFISASRRNSHRRVATLPGRHRTGRAGWRLCERPSCRPRHRPLC